MLTLTCRDLELSRMLDMNNPLNFAHLISFGRADGCDVLRRMQRSD